MKWCVGWGVSWCVGVKWCVGWGVSWCVGGGVRPAPGAGIPGIRALKDECAAEVQQKRDILSEFCCTFREVVRGVGCDLVRARRGVKWCVGGGVRPADGSLFSAARW
ncbi:hypothetical protein CAURIC_08355 [Corynebacterium auriscanis]|nr:hypothetical protein CAURIC_08355 [Corynebacterium auriscanis]